MICQLFLGGLVGEGAQVRRLGCGSHLEPKLVGFVVGKRELCDYFCSAFRRSVNGDNLLQSISGPASISHESEIQIEANKPPTCSTVRKDSYPNNPAGFPSSRAGDPTRSQLVAPSCTPLTSSGGLHSYGRSGFASDRADALPLEALQRSDPHQHLPETPGRSVMPSLSC